MKKIMKVNYIFCALADTGGAHRSVARVLHSSLAQRPELEPLHFQVRDIYSATSRFCNASIKLYPGIMDSRPNFYNWYFDLVNHPWAWEFFYRGFIRLLMKKKVAELFEHRPRLAVSTCALATRITADSLRHRGWKKQVPLIVVVVDLFTIHRSWAEPQADSYLVATGEAADSLVRNGINPERIHRIRFPLSPEFFQPLDQREARNRLGLDPDATTVLVMGGAGGNGDLTGITRLLDSEFSNLQVLVVTGWNSELESILREQYRGRGETVRIYGYTDKIRDLMRASDLLITRPGPCAMLEAITCRLPMVIHGSIPRQEEGNVKFLLDRDLGQVLDRNNISGLKQLIWEPEYRGGYIKRLSRTTDFFTGEDAGDVLTRSVAERWHE